MKSFLSPPWTVPAAAQGCLETQKSDATFFVLCFLEVVSVRLPACSLNGEGRWVELGIPGEGHTGSDRKTVSPGPALWREDASQCVWPFLVPTALFLHYPIILYCRCHLCLHSPAENCQRALHDSLEAMLPGPRVSPGSLTQSPNHQTPLPHTPKGLELGRSSL
jgi:hypothetical protein